MFALNRTKYFTIRFIAVLKTFMGRFTIWVNENETFMWNLSNTCICQYRYNLQHMLSICTWFSGHSHLQVSPHTRPLALQEFSELSQGSSIRLPTEIVRLTKDI